MDAAALHRLGVEELGLDAIGAAAAEPYEQAERTIVARREAGLFADMSFAMAHPEISCHPERLLDGARSVVSAALVYYAPGRDPGPGEGKLARYTRRDHYAELRIRLEELGRRLGGSYRVLVDSNDHVDREAAERAGVGFYGKNTLIIAPRLGSWIVLGTLVSTAAIETAEPIPRRCGSCRLCLDACPTAAFPEGGVLDARRCLSYWTQSRRPIPDSMRPELDAMVYGCDICQEVCPWNRGVEKRRSGEARSIGTASTEEAVGEPVVSLEDWLTSDEEELLERYRRLYVPRRDARFLRRNAIIALASTGASEHEALLERYAWTGDELLAEPARWALKNVRERNAA